MTEIPMLMGVFLVGIAASIIGTLVGGGSLLSIAFLIFLGLPAHIAIATDRLGSLGQAVTAFSAFLKAKRIVWKYVLLFSILSLVGSLIGANILVNIRPDLLKNLVGILILLLLPVLFLKKDIGTKNSSTQHLTIIIGVFLYLLVQIVTGFIGGGTGTLIFYILMMCFGLTIIESSATQLIPIFILNISSVAIFALHGMIDIKIGLTLLAGMAVGGYLGAHIALKKGDVWVKRIFFLLLVVMGTKLLLFK